MNCIASLVKRKYGEFEVLFFLCIMVLLNPYLNFLGTTEEAFLFYRSVFGGDFLTLQRFQDVPDLPGKEHMSEEDLQKIMHISLKIGENTLMGTDAMEGMGHALHVGNNISLSLHPQTLEEGEVLFTALSEGGKIDLPLQKMFWGAYFGMVVDRFGIQWMVNVET